MEGEEGMRDFIDCLEGAAEDRFFEMKKGLPKGKFRCDCGRIELDENANPASANPYSLPICQICYEESIKNLKEVK